MSAISPFHEDIDGLPVGKHSMICLLVSVVFNLRPRCMFVWDVKQVLDFVKEKFGDNDQFSSKELTLKVIIILALTTSSKTSALHILDLNHMIKTSEYYEFRFHKLHKCWRRDIPLRLRFMHLHQIKHCVFCNFPLLYRKNINLEKKKSSFSILS